MKVGTILALAILALSIMFSSCGIASRTIGVDISCDDFNEHPHSIRNEFEAEIGDKITVNLCSNPSTGFQWEYETIGNTVLKEESHDIIEPEDEGQVGTAGKEAWTFKVIDKGRTEIRLAYNQTWEGGIKEEWTYLIIVTVD